MQQTQTRSSMLDRMQGAAALDPNTYEEVEHDGSATKQAAIVVAITAVSRAIGEYRYADRDTDIAGAAIGALLGWLIWAGITYLVGTRFFKGTATWGELLRTLGFAQAPYALGVLGVLPLVGRFVLFVLSAWVLVAGIVAIRQALDIDTGKAILVAVVGFLVPLAVALIFGVGILATVLTGAAVSAGR